MRRTVRLMSEVSAVDRLAAAVDRLPPRARGALAEVADRTDLPLVAGAWNGSGSGCLVANTVAAVEADTRGHDTRGHDTLELRLLDLFPELSSRQLNRLIVAWDEAALQEAVPAHGDQDAPLRRLLRDALARCDLGGESGRDRERVVAATGSDTPW